MAETSAPSATRSAWRELKDERALVAEGYEFLDEKRMILAQELLRQRNAYREQLGAVSAAQREAVQALAGAVARHGLEGCYVYPIASLEDWEIKVSSGRFMGVDLLSPGGTSGESCRGLSPAMPSPEAELTNQAFSRLTSLAAELAVIAANLRRLIAAYVRTERRARAMENVLLPEIDTTLRGMEEQLEAVDQEEALRVRFVKPR